MDFKGGTGGISKQTPQAAIIINAAAESYEKVIREKEVHRPTLYPNRLEENFFVARGELCFAKAGGVQNTFVSGKNVANVQVFTSMNGYEIPDELKNEKPTPEWKEAVKRKIAKSIWFVGVAQGDKMKRDFENRSLALAIRVAGSDTITNSGNSIIHPGDTVVWDLPDPEGTSPNLRYGEPKTKKVFEIKKYNYGERQLSTDIQFICNKQIRGASDPRNSDESMCQEMVQGFLNALFPGNAAQVTAVMNALGDKNSSIHKSFVEMQKALNLYRQESYDRRIVGKAIGESKPGCVLDVLLHHHHHIG